MRAAEKVIARAADPEKRRGLVWRTQGSGKTYTMITVAKALLEDLRFQNPTVLMIVDRNELQQQLFQNLEAAGFSQVHVALSKRHLRDLLKQDTRGLVVSIRVDKIASFVADHFERYIWPMGYKAFLVAVDREACCFYNEALDRYMPSEMNRVVISRGHNDPSHISRYHLSDNEEAAVRKAFRKPDEEPQILIVTEKLLTGYDAPILYRMYLDKPMRDHVLLQAIARVNRPYEDKIGRTAECL